MALATEDVDKETAAELATLLGIPPDSDVLSQACQRTDRFRQAGAFAASATLSPPATLKEAKLSAEWESACHKELENMADKKVFELVHPPPGCTRPDSSYTATTLARFVSTPTMELFKYAVKALWYLFGSATRAYKLVDGRR
jgi:hypothetical protein